LIYIAHAGLLSVGVPYDRIIKAIGVPGLDRWFIFWKKAYISIGLGERLEPWCLNVTLEKDEPGKKFSFIPVHP